METLEALRGRRTVREFKPETIPKQVLDAVFEAAMWAPSHANAQPWEFVVVGPQARARLLALLQAKADELLADPGLPEPKRRGLLSLREDFGGAPFMVAVVSRPPTEDIERIVFTAEHGFIWLAGDPSGTPGTEADYEIQTRETVYR